MKSFLTLGLVVSAFLLSGCEKDKANCSSKKVHVAAKKECGCVAVHFGHDKYCLSEKARCELDALIKWMKNHPKSEVCLEGHASCVGAKAYNLKLSAKRANSVKQYLTDHGIAESRIKSKSYGETKLPAGKGHAAENRVVRVVKYS